MNNFFTEADLPLLNTAVNYMPDFAQIFGALRHMDQMAQYPILTFDHLSEMLGGPETKLNFLHAGYNIEQLRLTIPPYYFPISSAEDLIAKVAYLRSETRLPDLSR